MARTIKSTTTSTTKKVADKAITTVVDETTHTSSSEVISLDKNKKKAVTLVNELVRLREAITDYETKKQACLDEIYALMGWEKVLVDGDLKWVGVATKGTIGGNTKITISHQSRTEVNKKDLQANFAEIFDKVKYQIKFTTVRTKQTIPSRKEPPTKVGGFFFPDFFPLYIYGGKKENEKKWLPGNNYL